MTASQLLIVDIQAGFITTLTQHVPARAEALQESFDFITVTRFYNPQRSLFRRLLGENGYALGSTETKLAFAPRADAVIIDRESYSCVSESLIRQFQNNGVSRVHLCGIATETAVLDTALSLFDAGIEPIILAHACGSDKSAELHDAALTILKRALGRRQVIGS